jgi:hypothetical protein
MSDYLSSLAARSLRLESACEPRRAQMFEPSHDAPSAEPSAPGERDEGLMPGRHLETYTRADFAAPSNALEAHGRSQAQSPPRAPSPKSTDSFEPSGDTTPTRVARHTQAPASEPVRLEPGLSRVIETTEAGEHSASSTPARMNAAPLNPFAQEEARVRAVRQGAPVHEESREPAPVLVRNPEAESRTGSSVSMLAATVFDEEFSHQPVAAQLRPEETSTQTSVGARHGGVLQPRADAEARPVAAAQNVRGGALTAEVEQDGPSVAFGVEPQGARAAAREDGAQSSTPPIIEVTIGRIEVRAVTPPPASPPRRERHAPAKMSLDDYLRAHSGGRS